MVTSDISRLLVWGIVWPIAAVIAIQAAWALVRLFWPTPSRSVVQLVSAHLAAGVGARNDVATTLLGLQAQIRWPYPWRLRRAAAALTGERPVSLVTALIDARLLPRRLADSGRCAEAEGPGALARFFAELAGGSRPAVTLATALAPYVGMVLAAAGVLTFITVMVLPKFEMIFKDLGLALPARTEALLAICRASRRWWPILVPLILALVIAVVTILRHLTWRRLDRRTRALAILDGVAAGASEAAIMERIVGPADAARSSAAATDGGFFHLSAACGWRASTPVALAAAVAADEARHRWRTQATTVAVQICTPLLLAIPVWFILTSVFEALIGVIRALENQP